MHIVRLTIAMEKTDYKKALGSLYKASNTPVTLEVPPLQYLMIDGKGSPDGPEYAAAIQALYPVAYTLKFMVKKEQELDYGVMPLEGLWWAEDMNVFKIADKAAWLWTALILQPDFITQEMLGRAVAQAAKKHDSDALRKVRLETYAEGRAAQVMYTGPYANEGPTIMQLHEYIAAQGGRLTATTKHHHEIYLGDPRRTDPSKLKTIIRQPY